MSSTTPEEVVRSSRQSSRETSFGGTTALIEQESLVDPAMDADFESPPAGSQAEAVRNVLLLWMKWNAAHEQLSSKMFEVGHNGAMLEDLMDHVDQLRREAVLISEQLMAS
ncbi:MAG: hypothetical protein WBF93_15070 [Pirellulales bacterium]|nr:hypothetical protein [Pirellulales bacterium]